MKHLILTPAEEKLLEKLYFEDLIIELPKALRSSVQLVGRLFWIGVSGLALLLIFISLDLAFRNTGVLTLFTEYELRNLPFWLGLALLFFPLHHAWRTSRPVRLIPADTSFSMLNVADVLHPNAKPFLASALDLALANELPYQVAFFKANYNSWEANELFSHLELDSQSLAQQLDQILKNDQQLRTRPEETLKQLNTFSRLAFLEAKKVGAEYLELTHFFLALTREPHPAIENVLLASKIDLDDARNVALWLHIRRRLRVNKRPPRKIKHQAMNRSWTSKPTYFLDQFSHDLTDLARSGIVGFLIGHDKELRSMIDILSQESRNNVLLMGEAGSGRMTMVENLARKIIRDEVPEKLRDLRVVSLDVGALMAGVKAPGDLQQRLSRILDEILAAKNVVLVIPQIHDLMRAAEKQALSFMSFFEPVFQQVDFPVVATTDPRHFHEIIEPQGEIAGHFNIVKVNQLSKPESVQLLLALSLPLENERNIKISYFAIKAAVDLSERYIHSKLLPGKAIDILSEAIEYVKNEKGKIVTQANVEEVIKQRTGIPVTAVGKDESQRLLRLEQKLHERLINQEQAVKAVAEALREARTGLARSGGPIGSFLFIGPTGVGKTELSKTLAATYFGAENRMIRLDMSEYQNIDAIDRLIGSQIRGSSLVRGGALSEPVKQNPFSLILLDEFEKADSNVLNLFLQVLEDGRVTNELGQVIDFTNTIIIATSNAHSVLIKQQLEQGSSLSDIQQLLKQRLTEIFKPELLNRFDEIVVFRPLEPPEIKQIARLKLKQLLLQIEDEKGIKISITDEAVRKIATLGYDTVYGVRPIRHVIRKKIKNMLATAMLEEKIKRGGRYTIILESGQFQILPEKQTTAEVIPESSTEVS